MIVVSNTSPIVNLAVVGQLDLLRRLYGRIVIPPAVNVEIAVGAGQLGLKEIQTADWIETRQVGNRTAVASLHLELDEGESEAIALALELSADLLLVDERRARALAARLGLHFVGLLGVLIEAKHQKHIPAVRPVLDSLMARAGFWISKELYDHVLRTAGE